MFKRILLVLLFLPGMTNAQFIDKYIYQVIGQATPDQIIIDADNDGVDDFSFSFNTSTTASLDILTTDPDRAVGTFTANFAKAYFMNCNSVVDQNLNVTWNTLIAPFNSVPYLDPQYGANFSFSGLGFSNLSLYKAGFIPIKVNNKYGYILVEFQLGTSNLMVYGSRMSTQEATAVTIDCGVIGINDFDNAQNRFTISSRDDKCIIRNIKNIQDVYITDITGREIRFSFVKLEDDVYEIQLNDVRGMLLCHSRRDNETVRFVR